MKTSGILQSVRYQICLCKTSRAVGIQLGFPHPPPMGAVLSWYSMILTLLHGVLCMRMTNRTNWIPHKCTLHNRLHVLQWHLWCPGIDVRCLLKDVASCTQGTQIQADMTQGVADSVPRRFLYLSCPNHPSPDSFPHFTRVSGLPPFIWLWIRPPTLRLLEKLTGRTLRS